MGKDKLEEKEERKGERNVDRYSKVSLFFSGLKKKSDRRTMGIL
jgi:hypothetical protein